MRFSTITSLFLAITGAHAASSFMSYCEADAHTYDFWNFTLKAQCYDDFLHQRNPVNATLDIVNCYFALDGVLGCGAGGISGCSCENGSNGAGEMECYCPNNAGTLVKNVVNL
ncbi:hypothetical protein MCOR25_003804, partial [Pyricularia grisea]